MRHRLGRAADAAGVVVAIHVGHKRPTPANRAKVDAGCWHFRGGNTRQVSVDLSPQFGAGRITVFLYGHDDRKHVMSRKAARRDVYGKRRERF